MTPPGKERTTGRNRGLIALLGAVLLLMFLLAACRLVDASSDGQRSVDGVVSPPIALGAPAFGPDVAVSAVDFEPPLRPNSKVSSNDISLLVAIENKGDRRERDIQVVAQILGTEEEFLYSDTRTVDSLAAGEGRVVQFGRLSGLPLRPSYTVKVWTIPVQGEERLGNNEKTFQVPVSFSSP